MYGGAPERVTLRCENRFAGVMIDRFGKDAPLIPDGTGHFTLTVEVAVSPQFFGWLAGLDGKAVIQMPRKLKKEYKEWLQSLAERV